MSSETPPLSGQGAGMLPARPQLAQPEGRPAVVGAAAPRSGAVEQPARAELHFDPQELRQRLEESIERLNEQMRASGRDLNFSVDERLDRTIITVKSSESGTAVRQIPDEAVLRVAHSIEDLKGILFSAMS